MTVKKAIAAGQICLDITPDLSSVPQGQFTTLLQPGRMIQTGGFTLIAGGSVSNTGLALHKIGIPTQLIGKIGDDLYGQAIRNYITHEAPELVSGLVIDPSTPTSVTIILNPPGFDRTFLHFTGANDTFYASDLPRALLQNADLFHFGYPPSMRSIFRGGGAELVSILMRARRAGLTTSLDFTLPDQNSPAGKADWSDIMANSLPYVDLAVPSVQELTFLLKREIYDQMNTPSTTSFLEMVTPDLLSDLSEILLNFGVKAVLIKVGYRGAYLRTAGKDAWNKTGRGLAGLQDDWFDRELWAPAFKVDVKGTTGAGDAANAGFLASILKSTDPVTALTIAAASGAYSVKTADITSGLPDWESMLENVRAGWDTLPLELQVTGWEKDRSNGIWHKS